MDALRNLGTNTPHWVKRLDDLSGQIEQRQIELAKFAESQSLDASSTDAAPAPARSLRNKGSTESLKPSGEPAAHPVDVSSPPPISEAAPAPIPTRTSAPTSAPAPPPPPALPSTESQASNPAPAAPDPRPLSNGAGDHDAPLTTPSTIQQQKNLVIAAAQAKARATARKRNRSDSVVSAEGIVPKYRSRTMVIVYYDSYVQSFFEELVKFVSASRNMMRKAKMAAKVAQIKRLAELEMPDQDDEEAALKPDDNKPIEPMVPAAVNGDGPLIAADPNKDPDEPIKPLNYVSTRNMRSYGPYGRAGGFSSMRPYGRAGMRGGAYSGVTGAGILGPACAQKPDAFDELDKALEHVQSMCEHAAHQFLRDGDCDEEIVKIKRRLGESHGMATREMERILKEDPEAANEQPKSRAYRVQHMRRDVTSLNGKDGAGGAAVAAAAPNTATLPAATPAPASAAPVEAATKDKAERSDTHIEVDEGVEDVDWDNMPKLMYRSTRAARR